MENASQESQFLIKQLEFISSAIGSDRTQKARSAPASSPNLFFFLKSSLAAVVVVVGRGRRLLLGGGVGNQPPRRLCSLGGRLVQTEPAHHTARVNDQ